MILAYPLVRPLLSELLNGIRSVGSRSRHAGVVLLCRHDQLAGARALLDQGVDRIPLVEESDHEWRRSLWELLEITERHDLRAPIQVRADSPEAPVEAVCETLNISMSGMLVRCRRPIPIGTTLRFELSVPGDPLPIRGEAHVVRHTDPTQEHVEGVGASFLSFLNTDRSRLRNLLTQRSG